MKKRGLLATLLLLAVLQCTGCAASDQQESVKEAVGEVQATTEGATTEEATTEEATTEEAVTEEAATEEAVMEEVKLEIGETVQEELWTQTTVSPNIINDTFIIDVCLPDTYDESIAYPVVYLTDCYWRRGDYAAIKELYESGKTKEFILVGIGYPDDHDFNIIRVRDLLDDPDSFLNLILNGVMPYIESNYHVDPTDRTFCGGSFGGYFMVYSLFHDATKDVFKNYVLSSPTLTEKSYLKKLPEYEEEYSKKTKVLNANVYMTVGGDERKERFLNPIGEFVSTVKGRDYQGLNLEYKIYEGKEHNTVWVPSLLDGLTKFLAKE
jgi:predicted alpha/beta superfamily hydrolase